MSLKRLLKSIAWKMLPYAELETATPGGLKLPVRDKGEWGCLREIFIQRVYEPFWPHLLDTRGWVDLGCNAGFFSLGLLDALTRTTGSKPTTSAFLGDANQTCVAQTLQTIQRNKLAGSWTADHVVIGPLGETVTFSQFRYSVHSGIFSRQRGEKTFHYPTTDVATLQARFPRRRDLIKIDIEGAELFLFRHHSDVLKQFRYGLCEWHAPQFDGAAFREAAARLGFEVLEMRSQAAEGYDLSRGHAWTSPVGMALWRNPEAAAS